MTKRSILPIVTYILYNAMKIYATVSSERASKGQGGNEYIDIDFLDSEKNHIARLVFMPDANDPKKYVLVEDIFYRGEAITIKAYETCKDIPFDKMGKGQGMPPYEAELMKEYQKCEDGKPHAWEPHGGRVETVCRKCLNAKKQ